MSSSDFYSWKVMIRWYFLNDRHSEIIRFYTQMRAFLLMKNDDFVFAFVLNACCKLQDSVKGMRVHCHDVKAKT